MKLFDLLFESRDLDNHRDRFTSRFKTLMGGKSRTDRLEYTEKLVRELLKKEEVKFLAMKLHK